MVLYGSLISTMVLHGSLPFCYIKTFDYVHDVQYNWWLIIFISAVIPVIVAKLVDWKSKSCRLSCEYNLEILFIPKSFHQRPRLHFPFKWYNIILISTYNITPPRSVNHGIWRCSHVMTQKSSANVSNQFFVSSSWRMAFKWKGLRSFTKIVSLFKESRVVIQTHIIMCWSSWTSLSKARVCPLNSSHTIGL